MRKMKLLHVVGARPNYMKVAPLYLEMKSRGDFFEQFLVHTGQHYDFNMSQVFFQHLGLPDPDFLLGVGSGSHTMQTAKVMISFEGVVETCKPDLISVVGDVNSTLACALVAAKMGIRLAHIEAGLRSRDRSMPEEINRIVTDQLSDLLFTPSSDADDNLRMEGIGAEKIHLVGNVMIDTLVKMLPEARKSNILNEYKLVENEYILATLHRPSNVDNVSVLKNICNALIEISKSHIIVFPAHPRTNKIIEHHGLLSNTRRIELINPLGYIDFLSLLNSARLVLTDSGGIQEETSFLGIPCLTIRDRTERPVTVTHGTNRLIGAGMDSICGSVYNLASSVSRRNITIPLWDGFASTRIVDVLMNI